MTHADPIVTFCLSLTTSCRPAVPALLASAPGCQAAGAGRNNKESSQPAASRDGIEIWSTAVSVVLLVALGTAAVNSVHLVLVDARYPPLLHRFFRIPCLNSKPSHGPETLTSSYYATPLLYSLFLNDSVARTRLAPKPTTPVVCNSP